MNWRLNVPTSLQKDVARFAADSIRQADGIATEKWGLTPFDNGAIRLNAGFCEVLTAESLWLRVLVVGALLPPKLRRAGVNIETRGDSFYKSVPGSVIVRISTRAKRIAETLREIQPAHREAIRLALRGGVGKGVRDGHRDFAVIHLRSLAGGAIPIPGHGSTTRIQVSAAGKAATDELFEGTLTRSTATRHERNPKARALCIKHHGSSCKVCAFDFGQVFGALGEGFIEVHHLDPIAEATGRRVVDPIRDLIPVCSNCHRMLHRRDPPLTLAELGGSRK